MGGASSLLNAVVSGYSVRILSSPEHTYPQSHRDSNLNAGWRVGPCFLIHPARELWATDVLLLVLLALTF